MKRKDSELGLNYNFSEYRFPSSDGIHTIYAELYTPKNKTSKGIVQLAHGMIDYTGRYKELAEYLTGEGYILAGNHHLGHGKSVENPDDYGFFAEQNGIDYIIADMHTFNRYLRNTFPTLPLIVFGHSMGSFITRLYVLKHPHSEQGVVIHGTAGPNPLLPLGLCVTKMSKAMKGSRHRSKVIKNLAFGGFNKKFPKSEGEDAWLTREVSLVKDRQTDPYTGFIFTNSAYIDLFTMMKKTNDKNWFNTYPKDMKTLIVSGDADPVGNYGKGPIYVYKKLMLSGCKNVEMKLYPGARHELFNETNREEVFADIVKWLDGVVK